VDDDQCENFAGVRALGSLACPARPELGHSF
jgi:hypothetical protein